MSGPTFPISIVIPLYNESESFRHLIDRLDKLKEDFSLPFEVVMVDDGSTDNTAELMRSLSLTNNRYQSVFLSRNYGHQVAVSAGLSCARGTEAVMVIDGDLQDPPELLPSFYKKLKEGYDVVYGVRRKRKEGFLKKLAYYLFYRLQKRMSKTEIQIDSGDFCIMSRRMVDVLKQMPEESRYLRGMRAWVGFEQTGLEYERDKRKAGEPKYDFKMLFRLAYNGIFNFSELPVKVIARLGFFVILLSMLYLGYTLYQKIWLGVVPTGFTGLLVAITLFGGVQLLCLGIIGEYIIRIFFQVKNRPLYIIKEKIVDKEKEE